MKKLYVISFFFIFLSCSKSNDDKSSNNVEVIFEVESHTNVAFDYVSYNDIKANTPDGFVKWSLSESGTFKRHGFVKKGAGAFLQAQHPNSDQWKLRIKKLDGTVIAESGTIRKGTGNPSAYTGGCQAQIN
ncbi:hypothetical protein ACE38W_00665 [Chitinophaga sp. Hz27]|uniref:hypothetical protein n=1 Tax=Chitinophaga sp. Hz27 TaxID=3347169 RepID=UPI0035D64A94